MTLMQLREVAFCPEHRKGIIVLENVGRGLTLVFAAAFVLLLEFMPAFWVGMVPKRWCPLDRIPVAFRQELGGV